MRALYICGSLNQTQMMYRISLELPELEAYFTPYYCDGWLRLVRQTGLLDFTVMGGRFLAQSLAFLEAQGVRLDPEGARGPYDLVLTCSDLVVPKNIQGSRLVLVQEGMTDPENLSYHLVTKLRFPRWLAHTAATGLSDAYDIFCVASEGYRNLFIAKGVRPDKIRVTGIPNFDHCAAFLNNDFPHRDYVLVATSDRRETYKYEDRRAFIKRAQRIADGRQIIFKLHPNEEPVRARCEVERYAPGALCFNEGDAAHMTANCSALITRFSSVAYVAVALGKEVHSDIPRARLEHLLPLQNGGRSAANIAAQCLTLFD